MKTTLLFALAAMPLFQEVAAQQPARDRESFEQQARKLREAALSSASTATTLVRYQMPKGSLSFGYPKEFNYLENRSNEAKAVFGGKLEGKVVFFTVMIGISDAIFTEFPDTIAHAKFTEHYKLEAAADLIRGAYSPPPKILSQAYQKLGSLPCVALEHTHLSTDPRKPDWSHTLYAFTRMTQWNRQGIIVSLHCEPEDAERFRATITSIFTSFEFTK